MPDSNSTWERWAPWVVRGALLLVLFGGNLWQLALFVEPRSSLALAALLVAFGGLVLVSWVLRLGLGTDALLPVGRIELGRLSMPGELPLMLVPLAALGWEIGVILGA
jgi:hypothetical protein